MEGEREGEKHQCVVVFYALLPGDLSWNPCVCPDWESNRQHICSQAGAQSTEPQQPGQILICILIYAIFCD